MSSEDKYDRVLDEPGSIERPAQGDQAPFKSELTVIWKEEKKALHDRLDNQERVIEGLAQRIKVLEAWAMQVKREPMMFTTEDNPVDPPKQTPGAGIGQGIPRRGAVR